MNYCVLPQPSGSHKIRLKGDSMTTLVTRQRHPRRKTDEDLVTLERLAARLSPEVDGTADSDNDSNRMIEAERRARSVQRLAARNLHKKRRRPRSL